MRRAVSAQTLAFLSLLLVAASAARADDAAPRALLSRMTDALRTLDFQGSFIYEHSGRIDALRIFHAGGAHERERLVSLTGPRGEIVRTDNTITCVQSGAAPTLFANRGDLRLLPLVPNVRALGAEYAVAAGGDDRVAGYDANVVDIAPRDRYRYGYRLWIERNSRMLLRSVVLDAARRPLEEFMFVALDVGARPSEADLSPGDIGTTAVSPSDEVLVNARPHWTVSPAPAGFRLVRTQRPRDSASKAEHLVYSDGVASVSVYVEPGGGSAESGDGSTQVRGVLSIHSRVANGLSVTAVGNVPPLTVETMARAVQANDARRD